MICCITVLTKIVREYVKIACIIPNFHLNNNIKIIKCIKISNSLDMEYNI